MGKIDGYILGAPLAFTHRRVRLPEFVELWCCVQIISNAILICLPQVLLFDLHRSWLMVLPIIHNWVRKFGTLVRVLGPVRNPLSIHVLVRRKVSNSRLWLSELGFGEEHVRSSLPRHGPFLKPTLGHHLINKIIGLQPTYSITFSCTL